MSTTHQNLDQYKLRLRGFTIACVGISSRSPVTYRISVTG